MSGICGVVNFDGAPVDPELLRKMAEAAAYRGPDGIHYWIEGNVGLAQLALHTTPESVREKQPLVNRRGDLVLVADARVDNREDLIRILTSKGYIEEKDPTDADLILAAYECWREECPKQITGDFAFAVWDKREKRLFCTRDPLGINPFFYNQQRQSLYVGSTISSILAGFPERPPLNDLFIVDFLCWSFERWIEETIYQGISRLPGSFRLTAKNNRLELQQYWVFGGEDRGYKSDAEYIDNFRELFAQAVRVRMRSLSGVGISVSGGLDSSSVAVMAHHLVEKGVAPENQVGLYTCAFSRFPRADERVYQDAVAQKCFLFPYTKINGDETWGLQEFGNEGNFPLEEPEIYQIRSMTFRLLREAKCAGIKVVLSGEGGDQVMSSSAYWSPALLLETDFRNIGTEFKQFWKRNRCKLLRSILLEIFVGPGKRLLPKQIKNLFRQYIRDLSAPVWVKREWIAQSIRKESEQSFRQCHKLGRSARKMHGQLTGGWYSAALTYLNTSVASLGMEFRYPFLDRTLVNFMLVTPPNLRYSNGITKVILRKSMYGFLPEAVYNRTTPSHFSEVSEYGLREKEKEKLEALLMRFVEEQSQYLDQDKIKWVWQSNNQHKVFRTRSDLAPIFLQSWFDTLP